MFQGFSEETFDFLWGLYFNNERIWFSQHKEQYERTLYQPMKALAREVFEALTARYPKKELICKVTRIYRDARVYKGISCYKESLWFSILPPAEQMSDAPGFWFEVSRNEWSYGMGFYRVSPATMARHRQRILDAPGRLSKLNSALLGQSEFVLDGQSYAKLKTGAPAHLAGWYNLRSFSLLHAGSDTREVIGPDCGLARRLIDGFSFLMPFYDYFLTLSDYANPDRPVL